MFVEILPIPANAMQDCWISPRKPGEVAARLLLQFIVEFWVMFSTLVQHYKEACGMLMSAGPKIHEKQDLNSNLAPYGQSH